MKREKKIIIKIGSSSLINDNNEFSYDKIVDIAKQISILKEKGVLTALVSSGAIAAGMKKLGLKSKPQNMALKQACAALGQSMLMKIYDEIFALYNLKCAQILVNHDDFEDRNRMIHLSNTFASLFDKGIIPIINENDALAVDEIKVGDNDTLSAMIVPMINAEKLLIISDVDGLYNKNPALEDSFVIDEIDHIDEETWSHVIDSKSKLGTGGMYTKIKAAVIATEAGSDMVIMGNKHIDSILDIVDGLHVGTLFVKRKTMSNKSHWLLFKTNPKGYIVVDDGASKALMERKSLLPKGIKDVKGSFLAGSTVVVVDASGMAIAKGLSNYSSDIISLIMDKSSGEINLPLYKKKEVIHADNCILIKGEEYEHFNQ